MEPDWEARVVLAGTKQSRMENIQNRRREQVKEDVRKKTKRQNNSNREQAK